MKIAVKVHGSSGSLFGGSGQTVETKIEVDEEGFDTVSLAQVTHTLGTVAGMIVRDIARAGEPDPEPTPESEDAPEPERTEDGTHVRDTGGVPEGAGDVVRLTWDDGHRRTFIDTGEHYYSPEVVGKFSTPMAVGYDTDVQVDRLIVLGETLTPQAERESREHPNLQPARNLLTDAVFTADEAQEVRNLTLAAERRGDERGITHGR
ncbi:hypothetical protein QC999_gp46 [Microbacterium phage Cressida]|uniref:Uncharacterized protein n=1 Tax=Microbacterium phage Cressida TaxID=2591216 RepID=A0A514DI74_9CAUD|nr:hypothetical protein QC999_gp46 [Microbacterium phage Cressida]QDH93304.1 hypothetical protein PBI_CRESSIDA_62 [Microbacterium phage Cressida]